MKVFFDEDNGTGIPKALQLVRVPADEIVFPTNQTGAPVPKGTRDIDWIRWVAEHGFIAISQNQRLLRDAGEQAELVANGAGIVFLGTGRAPAWRVLAVLLKRWEWLEQVDLNEPRPFAFRLALSGAIEKWDFFNTRWDRVAVPR